MEYINIEIKARCHKTEMIRNILKSRNAVYKGKDYQIDTYFKVNCDRLKLREGKIENYLIYYDREDKKGPKQSNVILFKMEPTSSLKIILTKALGVLVTVEKMREIYFIENVKFHIGDVKSLGCFVEIEAIGNERTLSKKKLWEQCSYYLSFFEILEEDLIAASYCDLLLERL